MLDEESNLINYLESSSYIGRLVNYYGGTNPKPEDYQQSSFECIFAPISGSMAARYAINCDGKWLETTNQGVNIVAGFGGSGISVSNLSYISVPPEPKQNSLVNNGQRIFYYDTFLPVSPQFNNSFYHDGIRVESLPFFKIYNGELWLIQLLENEA